METSYFFIFEAAPYLRAFYRHVPRRHRHAIVGIDLPTKCLLTLLHYNHLVCLSDNMEQVMHSGGEHLTTLMRKAIDEMADVTDDFTSMRLVRWHNLWVVGCENRGDRFRIKLRQQPWLGVHSA